MRSPLKNGMAYFLFGTILLQRCQYQYKSKASQLRSFADHTAFINNQKVKPTMQEPYNYGIQPRKNNVI